MAKKWTKRIMIGLSIPIILILLIVILLYIPPIQNFLQRKVTAYVSRSTGMDITIDHVNLRFPLDLVAKDVLIIQSPDTILSLESLGLKVKLFPLLNGNIEAHGIFLENASVNTANMLPAMHLQGDVGRFYLDTRVISLSQQLVDLETAELSDAALFLTMRDTVVVTPEDTLQSSTNWKITLPNLEVKNVAFTMDTPTDTMNVTAYIGDGEIKDILADLGAQLYSVENISINNTRANYDKGNTPPVKGLDYSHIAVRDVKIEIDSVLYRGNAIRAVIRDFAMTERSGLSITSISGRLFMDSVNLMVPVFNLQTPHSEINFRAQSSWNANTPFDISRIEARLNARLGKQDVLLFAGDISTSLQKDYPALPLVIQVGAEGNMDDIQISRLTADLPGAISLKGEGHIRNITDSINRSADVTLQMQTQKLDFVLGLANIPKDGSIVIPPISMHADLKMDGPQVAANLLAQEGVGTIRLNADYNLNSEAYKTDLVIDSLQVNHFMPKDSIGSVSATANISGRGIDFQSTRTTATANLAVTTLEYDRYNLNGIELTAELRNALAKAHITSSNSLLIMDAQGEYRTNSRNIEASASVNVADVDIYQLGLIDRPMTNTLSLSLAADVQQDSVTLSLVSGDLEAKLRAQGPLQQLIDKSMAFTNELMQQINILELDHKELRSELPSARFNLKAGQQNPISRYFIPDNINFGDLKAGFIVNPDRGINGAAVVHGLRVDTLQLDTAYVVAFQDTARLNLRAGVTNGPSNPQYTFRASVTGEVRSEDAEVLLEFKNAEGKTGLRLGANARPQNNGFRVQLIPENPIVAFREFSFNNHDKIFIRNNGRVLADVQMFNPEGMGVSIQSMPDTTYLQNLDIEIRRIELADISRMLPYYPSFSGLFSAEAVFQQSTDNMQLSAEVRIGDLMYEEKRAGNIGVGATWLPGSGGQHYINAYVTLEEQEILTANGRYQGGEQDDLQVSATLEHVPLYLANLFLDEQLIELAGDLDGNLDVTGSTSMPQINGELVLDSVRIYSAQYGLSFRIDERPLQIANSRLTLDNFGIYSATGNDPFTVNGFVDFSDLSNARADLSLTASNFELLNAPRSEGRLLYGQAYIDLNSTIRGPLNELVMRGNINLLGTTKVNYVLTDSPLTVQDRLGDLVEFTSFSDTISVAEEETAIALGGFDLVMAINIDQSVKVGVDLVADRSNYVDIEGGGNLNFQYTPQGDMILTGRYTLTGGTLKYSLPIVPLKEFSINDGSYVEWVSDPMNPNINLKATETIRANVANLDDRETNRSVVFQPSIEVRNTLNNLELVFDLTAPEDPEIRSELEAMAPEERSKQAVYMMATGSYLARGAGGSGFNMGDAVNNFLQGQLANIAGSALKNVNISFDMESYDDSSGSRTDYNFKYAQRLFSDRVQVIIGGRISTGSNVEQNESFIDNVSLEYRLDKRGSTFVRLYHDRNYENVFEGEIVETGIGLVLRKKVNRLGELFIFKKRKEDE